MTGNGSSLFLRRALVLDCVISGISAAALLIGSDTFAALLGTSALFIRYAGASLVPFAAFVLYLSQRDPVSRAAVWTVIALNAAWVAGSILLLFTTLVAPTTIGTAFVILQAIAVAAFAEMQYVGLRKAWAAA